MSNILIINGAKKFAHSNGQLACVVFKEECPSISWHTARPRA